MPLNRPPTTRPLVPDERTRLYTLDDYPDIATEVLGRPRPRGHYWPWATLDGTRPTWAVLLNSTGQRHIWLCLTAVESPTLGIYPECGYWDTALTPDQAVARAARHAATHDADAAEERLRHLENPKPARIRPDLPDVLAAVHAMEHEGPVGLEAITARLASGTTIAVDQDYLRTSLQRLNAEQRLVQHIAGWWRDLHDLPCEGHHRHALLWATPATAALWRARHPARSAG